MIISMIKFAIQKYRRGQELDRRGWGSLGRIIRNHDMWDEQRLGREVRRSTRLHNLRVTGNPWGKKV